MRWYDGIRFGMGGEVVSVGAGLGFVVTWVLSLTSHSSFSGVPWRLDPVGVVISEVRRVVEFGEYWKLARHGRSLVDGVDFEGEPAGLVPGRYAANERERAQALESLRRRGGLVREVLELVGNRDFGERFGSAFAGGWMGWELIAANVPQEVVHG